jgi:N6-L-threonylcarbamoyladenine synthase
MPTSRHGKVRHLLRDKKAIIVRYHPFTIQLTKEKSNEVQEVSLGVDTGYETLVFQ